MKFDVFDENKNFITGEYFKSFNELYNPSRKVELVPKYLHADLLLMIDYGVSVYLPYHDGEDFLVQHLSPFLMEQCGLTNIEDVKGCLFSDVFPLYTKNHFLEFLREAYRKQTTLHFELYGYTDEGVFFKHYEYDVVGTEDAAFILAKDNTDYLILRDRENNLFDNSPYGLCIIQDNEIVRMNKKFTKMFDFPFNLNMDTSNFFDKLSFVSNNDSEVINEIIRKILNNEILQDKQVVIYHDNDDNVHYYDLTASLTTYNDKKSIQLALVDITETKLAQDEAFRIQNSLKLVESDSKFSIVNYSPEDGFIVTDEFFKILEMEPFDLKNNMDKFYAKIDEDTRREMVNHIQYMVENQLDDTSFQFKIHLKDKDKYVKFFSKILSKDAEGKPEKYVGYMMDVTDAVIREEKLAQADHDKAVLLKEIHHRVKNNLQIILSLINLDERFNPEDYGLILDATKSRIKSMALIHQKTYESESLSNINVKGFLQDYCLSILSLYQLEDEINLIYYIEDDLEIPIELMTPLSLMVNEFVTNTIKYAFNEDQEDKMLVFNIKVHDDIVNFYIKDNGKGLPDDLDIYNSPSLGLTIINSLTYQINGELTKLDCKGAGFKLTFPLNFDK
jgi:two-component sensor histidine kinase/PAS domain-containing protein